MKRMDRYLGIPVLYVLKLLFGLFGFRRSKDGTAVRSILMIKLWGIGNLVMILPLIKAVRTKYPRAELHFLTLQGNRSLLEDSPLLDHLITLDVRGFFRTGSNLIRTAVQLRRIRPDLVLDFEQFLRITPILASLSGAWQTIGFVTPGQARGTLYNVRVPYRKDRHMSLAFGDIVRSAGISTHGLPPQDVPRSPEAAARAEEYIRSLPKTDGPLVALHLGSGDNFPGRRWPVPHFARLAELLAREMDARCVITGTEPEKALGRQCREDAPVTLHDAIGRFDILTFIEFLARVDLLVTNDTAPAHIGSALRIPLIAFYGPNTPDLYGPLHEESRVFYNRLPCSPCLTNLNAKTSRCRMPACILGIEPGEAFNAAVELLRHRRGKELSRTEGEAS